MPVMRIEAYHQVARVYGASKGSGSSKAANGARAESTRDDVSISSLGRDYQIAKQAVAEAPDVREDKVAALAERVRSGNYEVGVDDFAAKLLASYHSLSL